MQILGPLADLLDGGFWVWCAASCVEQALQGVLLLVQRYCTTRNPLTRGGEARGRRGPISGPGVGGGGVPLRPLQAIGSYVFSFWVSPANPRKACDSNSILRVTQTRQHITRGLRFPRPGQPQPLLRTSTLSTRCEVSGLRPQRPDPVCNPQDCASSPGGYVETDRTSREEKPAQGPPAGGQGGLKPESPAS